MRKPYIAGNWKMYKTVLEAREALTLLRVAVRDIDRVDCGVAPPFPALAPVRPEASSRRKSSSISRRR